MKARRTSLACPYTPRAHTRRLKLLWLVAGIALFLVYALSARATEFNLWIIVPSAAISSSS